MGSTMPAPPNLDSTLLELGTLEKVLTWVGRYAAEHEEKKGSEWIQRVTAACEARVSEIEHDLHMTGNEDDEVTMPDIAASVAEPDVYALAFASARKLRGISLILYDLIAQLRATPGLPPRQPYEWVLTLAAAFSPLVDQVRGELSRLSLFHYNPEMTTSMENFPVMVQLRQHLGDTLTELFGTTELDKLKTN